MPDLKTHVAHALYAVDAFTRDARLGSVILILSDGDQHAAVENVQPAMKQATTPMQRWERAVTTDRGVVE